MNIKELQQHIKIDQLKEHEIFCAIIGFQELGHILDKPGLNKFLHHYSLQFFSFYKNQFDLKTKNYILNDLETKFLGLQDKYSIPLERLFFIHEYDDKFLYSISTNKVNNPILNKAKMLAASLNIKLRTEHQQMKIRFI